jgi:WD40 repeat protein
MMLWEAADPGRPRRLGESATGQDGVSSVAFARDGRTLASAGRDGTVILWDVADPARPRRLESPLAVPDADVTAMAFAPDGRTLAVATIAREPDSFGMPGDAEPRGTVDLWDVADPSHPRPRGQLSGPDGLSTALAFGPDGHTLITATIAVNAEPRAGGRTDRKGPMIMWDTADPARPERLGQPLVGHGEPVTSIVIAPESNLMATVDTGGTLILWDAAEPTRAVRIGELSGTTAVALAPDGYTLATGGAGDVALWEAFDAMPPVSLGEPLDGRADEVSTMAFAPDGRTLVTADFDGVQVWDLTGMKASRDNVLARACAITGGGIGPADWTRLVPGLAYEDPCEPGAVRIADAR